MRPTSGIEDCGWYLRHAERGRRLPPAPEHFHTRHHPLHRRFGTAADRLGAGHRRHAVGAGHAQRGGAELVGHPVPHPGVVRLRAHRLDRAGRGPAVVSHVHPVRLVPDPVHLKVGVEDEVGVLPGVGRVQPVGGGRREVEAPPRGAHLEGASPVDGALVARAVGEGPPGPGRVRIRRAVGVPAERRHPLGPDRHGGRRVDVAERPEREARRGVEPGSGPTGDDVHRAAQAALAAHVERPLGDVHTIDLREVDVERRVIHVVGARAVQPDAVDQHVQVLALVAAHHHVVRDPRPPHLPHAGHAGQRLAHVAGAALAEARRLDAVARGGADDLHLLGEGGQPHRQVHGERLSRPHVDARQAPDEAGERGREVVRPRREAGDAVGAVVRGHDAGHGAAGAEHVDRHAGQQRAVGAVHRAVHRPARLLGAGRGTRQQGEQEGDGRQEADAAFHDDPRP